MKTGSIFAKPDPGPGGTERPNTVQRSPGLTFVTEHLPTDRAARILDLGRASAESLNFYQGFSTRVRFEDIGSAVSTRGAEIDLEELASGTDAFDVIFCWDLVNYLSVEQLARLGDVLVRRSHTETVIHLYRSVLDVVPEEPLWIKIGGNYRVKLQRSSVGEMRNQIPDRDDLLSAFAGFAGLRYYLLKSGYEEAVMLRTERCDALWSEMNRDPDSPHAAADVPIDEAC